MIRYIAGLDWSGDPGDPSKNPEGNPLLVVCSCHVKVEDHFLLDDTLKRLRSQLRVSENYIFKHMRSVQSTRNMFMNAMIGCPVVIHVGIVDRRAWSLD